MDWDVIELQYYACFGKGDCSDTLEFEVELNEEQEKAYKKAVMTGTELDEVEELSKLCEKALPEIIELELENYEDLGEEYDEEYLENVLEVYLPDVSDIELESKEIEDYIRELKAAGDIETINLVVEAQEEYYESDEFESLGEFVSKVCNQ